MIASSLSPVEIKRKERPGLNAVLRPTSREGAAICWAFPMSESATLDCQTLVGNVKLQFGPSGRCRYFAAESRARSPPEDRMKMLRTRRSTGSCHLRGRISASHPCRCAGMMGNVSSLSPAYWLEPSILFTPSFLTAKIAKKKDAKSARLCELCALTLRVLCG